MNSLWRSNTNSFACNAIIAVLRHPGRLAAAPGIAQQRAHLIEFDALLEQGQAIVHVTGVSHQFGRRLERVGQDANAHVALAQVCQQLHPFAPGYEVRRDHQQLGLHRRCGIGHRPVHQPAHHLAFFARASCPGCRRPPARAPRRAATCRRSFRQAARRSQRDSHNRCRPSSPSGDVPSGLCDRRPKRRPMPCRGQVPGPGSRWRCSSSRRTSRRAP